MSQVPPHSAASQEPGGRPAGESGGTSESRPDVEAIMDQIRRAAEQAAGRTEDYAGPQPGGPVDVSLGIDDQALVERVMQAVRAMPPPRREQAGAAPPPPDLPGPVARQLGFDREREYGPVHRLLGKARRWLFRVTKIQAEFEKMYERINADLLDLERRTGAGVIELQQWLERRLARGDGPGDTFAALCDPLLFSPERRWGVAARELVRRAEEYVPFVREAARRARASGQRDALDLGCGEGILLEALRRADLDAEGIDPNPLRVRRCRERGLQALETTLGDFLLHCPQGEYRCVLAIHLLEHVAEAKIGALVGEFRRVLAPGGRLLVEVPEAPEASPPAAGGERIRAACERVGFAGVFAHGLHPAAESEQFPAVDASLPGAGQLNALIEKLNARFCGPRDTLIVAEM